VITWIDDACAATARQSKACEVVGIFGRTLQRWREKGGAKADGRKQAGTRSVPANKLSEYERQQILDVANAPKFAHLPPSQIVPSMADHGLYLASEASFYRVLREADQLAHRGKVKPATGKRPEPLQADQPNQLWSWDITYLSTGIG
jgi:transposase InsO family protein